ncbi:envelope stress response membrane protein PspB [Parashewanella tropica]|uniref:envelope stress response membrane protein PspB n=1 Tax=Parashewanella tropica TaxID=2547970 RepID=UPI001059D6D4|nr:envelope stress response membrane protein PspB [Parashewanella tropica]
MNPDILIAPLILFMIFVAPIWIIMHYRSKKQINQGLSEEEYKTLNQLIAQADRMAHRIETLEKILDVESPEWRNKHEPQR